MAIALPGRHPAFAPIGRLRTTPSGKKPLMMPLNLTAMVDMFTVIVIFLLQSFSASGELLFVHKELRTPEARHGAALEARAPVVTLFENQVFLEGVRVASLADVDPTLATLPALTERLRGDAPREGHLVVQGDRSTDFALVRQTIGSLNAAGWTHLEFAVTPLAGG